jgi:hypothetical protein
LFERCCSWPEKAVVQGSNLSAIATAYHNDSGDKTGEVALPGDETEMRHQPPECGPVKDKNQYRDDNRTPSLSIETQQHQIPDIPIDNGAGADMIRRSADQPGAKTAKQHQPERYLDKVAALQGEHHPHQYCQAHRVGRHMHQIGVEKRSKQYPS